MGQSGSIARAPKVTRCGRGVQGGKMPLRLAMSVRGPHAGHARPSNGAPRQ